jgi:hypothetical protein
MEERTSAPADALLQTKVNSVAVLVRPLRSNWNENKASFRMSTTVEPWLEPVAKPLANTRPVPMAKEVPVMLYSTEEVAPVVSYDPPVVVPPVITFQL